MLEQINCQPRCMDRADVLGHLVSIRVKELLIVDPIEGITVDAHPVLFPQLEADARRSGRDTAGSPTYMKEPDRSICYLFPGPHAYRI